MANRFIRDGDYVRDGRGRICADLSSDKSKCYAVIVMCGHCGDGFYIPIMFSTFADTVSNAIAQIKMAPRVKREKSDCVLDAFEITELEKFFVDSYNDRDPYLKGTLERSSKQMEERKVLKNWKNLKNIDSIKTADQYSYYSVLERSFAPRYVGSELVTPSRVNKNELLKEMFKCAAIRYGVMRDDPFFLFLYYLQYGKNNDLEIVLNGDKLTYRYEGRKKTLLVSDKIMKFYDRFGVKEDEKQKKSYYSGKPIQQESQIDKFRRRMDRYNDMKKVKPAEEPGESEPGE